MAAASIRIASQRLPLQKKTDAALNDAKLDRALALASMRMNLDASLLRLTTKDGQRSTLYAQLGSLFQAQGVKLWNYFLYTSTPDY